MTLELTEEQWKAIDEDLFAGFQIDAVVKIRQCVGLGVNASAEIMYARYRKLREEQPDKFVQSHEEYWIGWYS